MKIRSLVVIALSMIVSASALAADVATTAPTTPSKFTPEQLKQVDDLVQGLAQACTQNPLLASKDDSARMMAQWGSTPDVCACQGTMLRSVLTPEVLILNPDDQRKFFLNFALTKNAECIVPALKKEFSAACENFLGARFKSMPSESAKVSAALKSRGYADLDAYLASTCSCLRPAFQQISTKDWVDGAVAAYNAYLERKRTGNQSLPAPKGVFDQVLDKCIVPLAPGTPSRPAGSVAG